MKAAAYLPILKWKQGEYQALRDLPADAKAVITPLVEVVPVVWDYANDAPKKTLAEHLDPVPGQIAENWGTEDPILVDLGLVDPDGAEVEGSAPGTWLFDQLRHLDVKAVPVISLSDDADALEVARRAVSADRRGLAIRLRPDDVDEEGSLEKRLDEVLAEGGVDPADVDLVVDLGAVTSEQAAMFRRLALSTIREIPELDEWRSFTLAAGAFPPNLSGLEAGVHRVPRADLAIWQDVVSRLRRRAPVFGDYAIAHPDLVSIDPRMMQMSANIRYTTTDHWLVLKGRNVRTNGWSQTRALCADLVRRSEYSGRDFSPADRQIDDCANSDCGPGNATTWRKVGTNHHLTFVARQVSSGAAP